jgi:hypothetical protein
MGVKTNRTLVFRGNRSEHYKEKEHGDIQLDKMNISKPINSRGKAQELRQDEQSPFH